MEPDLEHDLGEATEETFGGGRELATTGYFVFGLLTFWLYTVVQLSRVLARHIEGRRRYFEAQMPAEDRPPGAASALRTILEKGFTVKKGVRFGLILAYGASMGLILAVAAAQYLVAEGRIDIRTFDWFCSYSVGLAALLFSGATVLFLTWVSRLMKDHEYHELLWVRLVRDPAGFRMVHPSASFVRRWNRKQNWVTFFLILSLPMTVSPFLATRHLLSLAQSGVSVVTAVQVWMSALSVITAVFHFWGTQVLIRMYNDHLRIETVNQQLIDRTTPFASGDSATVLATSGTAPGRVTGAQVPERALAALMLTDIVGFSRDMERDEAACYEKLTRHNDMVRQVIARHNGWEIKTIGDAFLVKFGSAVQAVQAAMEIQAGFRKYNKDRPEIEQIWIRIGVHIGDVLIIDRDVLGNGVNIASRIEPLAEPGGICISADVYSMVHKSIELKVVNLGRRELKNIKDAPEIYKILLDSAV
jgi:class 3 adenylate cyclase